jgi:hypothetical protein
MEALMPIPRPLQLDVSEARRILTDPVLCDAMPSLRRIAFYAAATARGKPARQIRPAHPFSGDAA